MSSSLRTNICMFCGQMVWEWDVDHVSSLKCQVGKIERELKPDLKRLLGEVKYVDSKHRGNS